MPHHALDDLTAHLVANGFPRVDWSAMCETETQSRVDAVMKTYGEDVNYIDLMPDFARDMQQMWMVVQEAHGDEHGIKMLTWLGNMFADLVAFEINESM